MTRSPRASSRRATAEPMPARLLTPVTSAVPTRPSLPLGHIAVTPDRTAAERRECDGRVVISA